jgi:hypothetical protein
LFLLEEEGEGRVTCVALTKGSTFPRVCSM